MNISIMLGRLTEEPIQSVTLGGKLIVKFSIAVSKKYKRENGPTADYFNCVAWERDAENIFKFFHKGDSILIKGRFENDNYKTRDGTKVYGMVYIVEEWDFGQKKLGR